MNKKDLDNIREQVFKISKKKFWSYANHNYVVRPMVEMAIVKGYELGRKEEGSRLD